MLKLVGGLLVVGGCCLWGFRAAADLSEQVRILEEFIHAIRVSERELALFRPALPELLLRMAQGRSGVTRAFLHECLVRMGTETDFPELWERAVDKLPLAQQEKRLLCGFGQVLGRYDDRGQVQVAQHIRQELEACAERARQNNQVRGKLYRTLGATAGGFLLLTLM